MRTTLDLDEQLLADAQGRFPPGTPKTVILEEALRRLLAPPLAAEPPGTAYDADPRMHALIAEGRLQRATGAAPKPGPGGVPLKQLLADLAKDREDR